MGVRGLCARMQKNLIEQCNGYTLAAACEPPLTTPMDGSVLALVDPHALL